MKSLEPSYDTFSLDVEEPSEKAFTPIRIEVMILMAVGLIIFALGLTTQNMSTYAIIAYSAILFLSGLIGRLGES